MKVGMVNNCVNYAHNIKQSSKQNFKGMWGTPTQHQEDNRVWSEAYQCDFGELETWTEQYYYPFKDETQEDIKKAIKNKGIVNVMPTIPVTAKEYKAYIARELLSKQEMEVEDKLKMAKLQVFLNVKPYNNENSKY